MKKPLILVYTCGTFDLFHYGHLKMLQYAKGLGDKLIVSVSTDELVKKYKGKKPIVPFEERIAIVRELKCVDLCIPQKSRDKYSAWEKIGYDIWVVGDDWYNKKFYIDMRRKLEKVNVKSIFLPYTKGLSSTLRTKIVKNKGILPKLTLEMLE